MLAVMTRRWIRFAFLTWAVVSTSWLVNSMRTRGVAPDVLRSSPAVRVVDSGSALELLPGAAGNRTGLVFICGAGVSAQAYAPMLRPIADAGHPVVIVRLPYRFAPFPSHKDSAVSRAHAVIDQHPSADRWVVAGHSLGGALASRVALSGSARIAAVVLIGTTHPRDWDLSSLTIPIAKIYGSNDGVAPPARMFGNRHLLPQHTLWVEIKGGNHSRFGHYGHQLRDGKATITRDHQQALTRDVLLQMLGR